MAGVGGGRPAVDGGRPAAGGGRPAGSGPDPVDSAHHPGRRDLQRGSVFEGDLGGGGGDRAGGFLVRGCVKTYGPITFVNRTEETSFVLCMGQNGNCARDDAVPRELRARLAVEPGTERVWEFPP